MPPNTALARHARRLAATALATLVLLRAMAPTTALAVPQQLAVTVEIVEGIPEKRSWEFEAPAASETYHEPAFGFVAVPQKWSDRAVLLDRSSPFLLRAAAEICPPPGEYHLLLRSRNAARLLIDGRHVVETPFIKPNANGHESVPDIPVVADGVPVLRVGDREVRATVQLDGMPHRFQLEAIVGGQKLRMELGELVVAIAAPGHPFQLLSPNQSVPFNDTGWHQYTREANQRMTRYNEVAWRRADATESAYWAIRHQLARQMAAQRPAPTPPARPHQTTAANAVDRFILERLEQRGVAPTPIVDDLTFLRRVTLDTVGVIPTHDEITAFLRDDPHSRRTRAVERLLADPRWADHWVGYWQDVLAENPGILKPTLNNTGPFRWWIHHAFLKNLPMDRFVTELLTMSGSTMYGGPAGFAMATLNDAPMAAKAHIAAKAFLGIELQCARCHDAPFHPYKQQDLFALAAMLAKSPAKVPSTSTVPAEERSRRPLVQVTLEPGSTVDPAWPFADLSPGEFPPGVLRDPDNPRERLAALVTSPHNDRFAQVIVNRLWKRYLGLGLVEPVDDWTSPVASHPELLEFLARELVTHNYDLKHVARLVLTSHTYQRTAAVAAAAEDPEQRLFAAPARRRMTAEQLVDSLFLAAGKEFASEELCLDVDGRRPITEFINLGTPVRAWQFTSLSNERDRPALSLPVAQSIVDLLTTFGWRESRQNPITVRDETPTPLQPLVLANGVVGSRIARLCDDSAFTARCLEPGPVDQLVDDLVRRVLSRPATEQESALFTELLSDGYADRFVAAPESRHRPPPARMSAVSWSNHLSPEATRLKLEQERLARAGDPPTVRLKPEWRERAEDMIWAMINSPEFVFVP